MENIKKFPRGILAQVISLRAHDGERERAPGPGLKQKLQASSFRTNPFNCQAASIPTRVTSVKLQA